MYKQCLEVSCASKRSLIKILFILHVVSDYCRADWEAAENLVPELYKSILSNSDGMSIRYVSSFGMIVN